MSKNCQVDAYLCSEVVSLPVERTAANLSEYLYSPQMITILGLMGVMLILSLFQSSSTKGKGARYAKPSELRRSRKMAIKQIKNRHKNPNEVGIVLDNDAHEGFAHIQTSMLFSGAVKTGKTFYGINPTVKSLLDRGDSVVLFDYKYPSQTQDLIGYAQSVGYSEEDIHVFAPSFPESCIFNPVEAATPEYASTLAETFVKNFTRSREGDPFFGPAGIALTEATLSLARDLGGDIATCQAILSRDELPKRIQAVQQQMNPWSYAAFSQFLSTAGSEKTASSIAGTAQLNFSKFVKPHLVSAFMGASTLPLRLEGKKFVVLGCNYNYRQSILPVLAVVLQLIIDSNVFLGRKTPLTFVLDEFPTLYLPSIVEQINAIRSYGLFFILGIQNFGQLALTYGQEQVKPIVGATRTKVCYNPSEYESAKYFSDLTGDRQFVERETSRNYSEGKVSRNKSKKKDWRPLLPPDEILLFGVGRRLVFSEGVGTKAKGFRPYITQSEPNDEAKAAFKLSNEKWPELREKLVNRSTQAHVTPQYLAQQISMIDSIMPIPKEKAEDRTLEDFAMEAFN